MPTTRALSIPRGPYALAGELHLPDQLDAAHPRPVVVIATPGSSVKEQIGANYGTRLAAQGLIALAFDPGHQGRSGGPLRDLEDPYARGEDISAAVDAITSLDVADPSKIGVLGICAGGGYAVHTARTDHRIKAVGTVVPVNIGRAYRQANTGPRGSAGALDELAATRAEEARTGDLVRVPWLPDTLEEAAQAGITDIDTTQAVTFYRTPRGYSEHSTNRRLSRSDALLLGYDAFHLVSELLTQPLQVILSGRLGNTGSYGDGLQLWEMAPNRHDLMVVEGAGHYEMYDDPDHLERATRRLVEFYAATLLS